MSCMSKLIDADKLKEEISERTVVTRKTERNWYKNAFEMMELVDNQPEVLLSCPKCHGIGEYIVPMFDYGEFPTRYEKRPCEICHKTGKLTVEDYEMLQEACSEK